MTDLILRCQRRVDQENSALIARTEWCNLISEAYGELYTIVFEAGLEYFEYTQTLTTTGASTLSEVTDHLSTVALSCLRIGTTDQWKDLRELMAQERSQVSGMTGSYPTSFALVDDLIYLYPTPPAGLTLQMRYVPQPPDLVEFNAAQNVLVDVVTPDGLAFLIWCVAVKAIAKAEADASLAIQEREQARERFTTSGQLRALNAPRRRIMDDGDATDDWRGAYGDYG